MGRSDKDELMVYIGSDILVQGEKRRVIDFVPNGNNEGFGDLRWRDNEQEIIYADGFIPVDDERGKYPTAPTTNSFPYIRLFWRITDDYEGGEFHFFDNFVLPKNKNSLIGFRTNRNSHHGVTEISSGERISIIIDFWSSTQTDDEGEFDYYFFSLSD